MAEKKRLEIQLRLSGQIKDRFLEIKRAKGLTDDEVLRLVINDFFEKKKKEGEMKMDNPKIRWEDWDKAEKQITEILAFVNSILEEETGSRCQYFFLIPDAEGIDVAYVNEGKD